MKQSVAPQRQIVRDIDLQVEYTQTMGFPLSIRFQALTASPSQGIMQNEIQGQKIVAS